MLTNVASGELVYCVFLLRENLNTTNLNQKLICVFLFFFVDFPKWFLQKFANGFPADWKKLYEKFLSESKE